jgi:hypothetical protein
LLPFPGVPETAIVTGWVDGGGVHEAGSGRDIESRSSNHWQPNLKEAAVCSVILQGSARLPFERLFGFPLGSGLLVVCQDAEQQVADNEDRPADAARQQRLQLEKFQAKN